jgi:hypothetical protein
VSCAGQYFLGDRRVVICVNGILTRPGAGDGWTDRSVTWLNTRTTVKAEKFEYACGAITRRWRQKRRAYAIARMVGYYYRAGFAITLVGHSNGCDLIARVIANCERIHFASVHLFAAAADWAPFSLALHAGRVSRVFLYVSANDRALQLAGVSRTLFGWAGLGYGNLGREVPAAAEATAGCTVIRQDEYGHSTWFERGDRFESTMRLLVANEQSLSP